MEIISVPVPSVTSGRVIVRVAFCGICGSDLTRYTEGAVQSFPQVLGHEFSGTIAKVGDGVVGLTPGLRVVVAPLIPCGTCDMCQAGRPALCASYSFLGSREQGGLAEFVSVPAENVTVLPASVSLRQAALIEPLTIALHGVDRAEISRNDSVAVFGAGVIGLLAIIALRRRGAERIVAVDTQSQKLELARHFGADDTVLAEADSVARYFAEHQLPNVCVETAGSPVTRSQAIEYCSRAGQVVFIGTSKRDVSLRPDVFEKILRGELRLTGSWMSYSSPFPGGEWAEAVDLIASGTFNVDRLIDRTYDLDDEATPFADLQNGHGALLKLLYRIDGDR